MAFAELSKVKLEYFPHGEGPERVVFIHGFQASARIWRMTQEALPGDRYQSIAINNRGEVVGMSCGAIDCAAYHWHKGVMVDLNAVLVGAPPGLYVISANDINDRGEIAAAALDPTFGDQVGVVLVPVEGDRD